MAKKLEQTRGEFQIKGNIKGIDRDNAFEEGIRPDGAHAGRTFRKLNLGVQTSPDNQLRLGLFSYEPEKVFMWNNEKRKKMGDSYKGDYVPWEEYLQKKDILKENGTAVLQARVGVEYGDDGKLKSEGMTTYEAAELIYDNVDNDDSVYVEGQISYSEYKNKNTGQMQTGINYNLNRLFKSKTDFDLRAEDYEAQDYYEQEFVFVDTVPDKENDRLIVIGRVIDYRENTVDTNFMINYAGDKDMQKLATSFHKKFKFGDLVKVFGQLVNKSVEEEVEVEEDDALASLGGKSQPTYAKSTSRSYVREMTIDGVLSWEKAVYTVDDFEANEILVEEEEEEDLTLELGGKAKKKNDNPFDEDEEEDPFADTSDSDLDDELPF